ncbi:MAG: hypothetical protein ACE5SW_09190, partial [Nitrososphaeraceae archaeon]
MIIRLFFERNRPSPCIVMYSLYLYFLGLSLRNTSKALEPFNEQNRSHVTVWEWINIWFIADLQEKKNISIR